MHYYKRIEQLRKEKGKTQKQVAEQIGMRQPHYTRYEKGERDTPTEKLKQLAKLYEVSIDYILEMTDERKPYPPAKED